MLNRINILDSLALLSMLFHLCIKYSFLYPTNTNYRIALHSYIRDKDLLN